MTSEKHLRLKALLEWQRGASTADELLQEVLPLLGSHCRTCRGILRSWKGRRQEEANPTTAALAELRRALGRARRHIGPTTLRDAEERLDHLMALPPGVRLATLDRHHRAHRSHLLVLVTLDRVRKERAADPEGALDLLETAHTLVMLLDQRRPEELALQRSLAVTVAVLRSSVHRIRTDLPLAQTWMRQAKALAFVAQPDTYVLAELQMNEGALHIAQRRLTPAVHRLASAALHFGETGDSLEQAQCLLLLAAALRLRNDPQGALDALAGATFVLHPTDDLLTYVSCQMQRALILCDLEEPESAAILVEQNRHRLAQLQHVPSVPLRLRWLEGRIAFLRHDHDEARSAFEETRALALERGNAYDAALVSLDLARVHLDRFDFDALREEAKAIIPVLAAEGLHDEAGAALSLYRDALMTGFVEQKLVERLSRYLEAARRDPELRFRTS